LGAGGDIKHITFNECDFEDNWYNDGARTTKFGVDVGSATGVAYSMFTRFNNSSWNINVATEKAICFNDVIGGILDNPWVCNIPGSISIITRDVSFHNLTVGTLGYDWTAAIVTSGGAIAFRYDLLRAFQGFSSSIVWDPGSLNDGVGETSASITVTGAILGDFVIVSAPYDLQGITCNAYVDAADSVKIRIQNETGGVINLDSGTWRVRTISKYVGL
jgi:hypothetical protein